MLQRSELIRARRWPAQLPAVSQLLLAVLLLTASPSARATGQHHIAAANLVVVQNDTGNTTNSVTVTTALAINDFRIRAGSNRADYDIQIGEVSTDDVPNGILISCIDQNGRDNGESTNYPGMNYGASAIDSNASTSPGSSGEYWIPVFQAPTDSEYNFNVAAAYFPYTNGWYGGWLNNAAGSNGGANNHFIGNTNLVLGRNVIDLGSGQTTVNLLAYGLDARTNAVLLVCGGKNEANYALSAPNTNGTWTVTCHDDNGGAEQDYIAFVGIPLTNQTVVAGRFMGDARIALQSAPFQVSNPGIGTYHLTIPGVNPANGVLIVSAESGGANNSDNLVSYQVHGDGWDIQTRDITAGFTPALQNLPASDAVASFVYIPGPDPGSPALAWTGAPTNLWNQTGGNVWRLAGSNTPAAYADGSQVICDDTASNFTVTLTTAVQPYAVTVSNNANSYLLGGSGTISGPGGLTKQGTAGLTLATGNNYTGNTVVTQGRVTLAASQGIPGGPGFGDLTVNGTLDLAGWDATFNNLTGTGKIDTTAAGALPVVHVNATTNGVFAGTLTNTAGVLSLTLSGGGKLTLAGTNTLGGRVTVTNGTLAVNGSLAMAGLSVQPDATLAGTGAINGSVTLADNASLVLTAGAPLSVGALNLTGTVNVCVAGGYTLTNVATYGLLRHGAVSGGGSFRLANPVGLACNGFSATLQDTGAQLQMVVTANAIAGTLADVRHVVVLMNENRSFDHYLGTFHGTRGFNDRNAIQFTNHTSAFYQPAGASYELPFHTSLQCLTDLNHTWPVTHSTVNGGKNDQWIANKGAETMVYYTRADLPFYYALADAYTVCDEYHCSVLSSTSPNRVSLMTGMVDPNSTGGGPEIDNTSLAAGFAWTTYPEMLQSAGITWKVYQVNGDNSDNVLQNFAPFKQAKAGDPLYDRGMTGSADVSSLINQFAADVANHRLPSVSWIIGPGGYTEHPSSSPASGEWFTKQMLDALASSPEEYNSTVFIMNYDENDGFFDHAMPILPPVGTTNEYVGSLPIGLGIRVPCIIASPWSRGGRVCSQVFDHTSVIRFLETWTGVKDPNISAWRRQVCGDLTNAFDFAHPNTNYPGFAAIYAVSCSSGTTPSVPSPQTVPVQETGTATAMPLPYQPEAWCTLDSTGNNLIVTLTNAGAASFHFAIYPAAYRNDGPWPYDVPTGGSASNVFNLAGSGGWYDFACYGPDGFQRRFAGSLAADYQKLEARSVLNSGNAGAKIQLINGTAATVNFVVTNGYVINGTNSYTVPAHATNVVNLGSGTNGGLYDITVTTAADTNFVRRFLGRVEPITPPAVLTAATNPGHWGDRVRFTATLSGYGIPGGSVQFRTNGVAAGNPVPLTNGTASFTTQPLGCGDALVSVEYGGDGLNPAQTNVVDEVILPPAPTITLNGSNPLTNWLGTALADPGAVASDPCSGLLPVTTNNLVNAASPGTYQIQYSAVNGSGITITNIRSVFVKAEQSPVLGAGVLVDGGFSFNFSGPVGQPYKVLTATNLFSSNLWSLVLTGAFGPGPTVYTTTNTIQSPARFYRLVSP